MTAADFRIRRATLDDLPALRTLWQTSQTKPMDLEKRFTEMQVAEIADGQIVGAIGLKIERLHALIHSDIISDAAHAGPLHEAFWQRLQVLARNHGLFRLWTQSNDPYWTTLGFRKPDEKEQEKMPESFGPGEFLTFPLKAETAEGLSVEKKPSASCNRRKHSGNSLMQFWRSRLAAFW
jgi:N-acetylglutamate synthase-like GNAT family acetyltransferase